MHHRNTPSPKTRSARTLNVQQRRAAEHGIVGHGPNIAGPLLIIAGAGTGKTNSLAHRVSALVAHGADPSRILLLTFTRRAADELGRRAASILSQARGGPSARPVKLAWAGTFHSVAVRLLRHHARRVGLTPAFTILDAADAADQIDLLRHELGFADLKKKFPNKDTCLAIHSCMVNTGQSLKTVVHERYRWCREWKRQLAKLFAAYATAKRKQNVVDFDDLLSFWHDLVGDRALAAEIGDRFDHVLVDEYQDTNALQASILRRMKPDGAGVTVVGDDAQSIFSFRGAEVRNILDFPKQFRRETTLAMLDRNYRSTAPILAAANGVMTAAAEGYTKSLRAMRSGGSKPILLTVTDEHRQAERIARQIHQSLEQGRSLKEQAVLFRASHHSAMLEIELARWGIPFKKFGGITFMAAAHVKDVLAVLKWAENPADRVAAYRILKLMPGFGPATAARALAGMSVVAGFDGLADVSPPRPAVKVWRGLIEMMKQLQADKVGWPQQIDAAVTWYRPLLETNHDDAEDRAADLDQLIAIGRTFKSRQEFLTNLTLDPPPPQAKHDVNGQHDDDILTLSTIHAAKGREWRSVFVLNVVEGGLPSARAKTPADIEEERRLLYVAMTRAKRELTLACPRQITTRGGAWGGTAPAVMQSRFISDAMLDLFDCRSWH